MVRNVGLAFPSSIWFIWVLLTPDISARPRSVIPALVRSSNKWYSIVNCGIISVYLHAGSIRSSSRWYTQTYVLFHYIRTYVLFQYRKNKLCSVYNMKNRPCANRNGLHMDFLSRIPRKRYNQTWHLYYIISGTFLARSVFFIHFFISLHRRWYNYG